MKDGEIPEGNSEGGYNKLISQEDVTADDQALYSIQEKQQGTDYRSHFSDWVFIFVWLY